MPPDLTVCEFTTDIGLPPGLAATAVITDQPQARWITPVLTGTPVSPMLTPLDLLDVGDDFLAHHLPPPASWLHNR